MKSAGFEFCLTRGLIIQKLRKTLRRKFGSGMDVPEILPSAGRFRRTCRAAGYLFEYRYRLHLQQTAAGSVLI
jgi:hypothetical protein